MTYFFLRCLCTYFFGCEHVVLVVKSDAYHEWVSAQLNMLSSVSDLLELLVIAIIQFYYRHAIISEMIKVAISNALKI